MKFLEIHEKSIFLFMESNCKSDNYYVYQSMDFKVITPVFFYLKPIKPLSKWVCGMKNIKGIPNSQQ